MATPVHSLGFGNFKMIFSVILLMISTVTYSHTQRNAHCAHVLFLCLLEDLVTYGFLRIIYGNIWICWNNKTGSTPAFLFKTSSCCLFFKFHFSWPTTALHLGFQLLSSVNQRKLSRGFFFFFFLASGMFARSIS